MNKKEKGIQTEIHWRYNWLPKQLDSPFRHSNLHNRRHRRIEIRDERIWDKRTEIHRLCNGLQFLL